MNTNEELYFEVKKLANNHNITIDDSFIGEKTFVWRIKKSSESLIMPAKKLNLSERLNLLLRELKIRNLENVFLLPKIRESIELSDTFLKEEKVPAHSETCELCGKKLDFNQKKFSMINICQSCIRNQVRHNINYSECKKEFTGKYCIDCPTNIYKNCPVMKKTLNPDINSEVLLSDKTSRIKSSRLNRLGSARLLSNDNNFIR